MRNGFFQNHAENEAGRLVLDLFLFFKNDLYDVKASGKYISCNMFRRSHFVHDFLRKYLKFKYFSYYVALTDQISLFDCLYFLRYLAIYVLQLFVV